MAQIASMLQGGFPLVGSQKIPLLKILSSWICSLVWLFCLTIEASADLVPMNGAEVAPNVAEIRVSEKGVHIQLEVFFGDILKLDELVPDSLFQGEVAGRADEQARMATFSENGLSIRRPDGAYLPVVAKVVEPRMRIDRSSPLAGQRNPLTGQVYPAPPEDQRVLYAELFYDFGGRRPEQLLLTPPLGKEGNPLVTIGMVVFDRDVPVIDFRYLSGAAELTIDWDDPWYSGFANPNLSRHHRFPFMAFLYAEPYEIRHEALLRVRDAAELIGLSVDGDFLSDTDLQVLEAELPPYFGSPSAARWRKTPSVIASEIPRVPPSTRRLVKYDATTESSKV